MPCNQVALAVRGGHTYRFGFPTCAIRQLSVRFRNLEFQASSLGSRHDFMLSEVFNVVGVQ